MRKANSIWLMTMLVMMITGFVACNGQTQTRKVNSGTSPFGLLVMGDTMSIIGKNLDAILHDKQGVLWLALKMPECGSLMARIGPITPLKMDFPVIRYGKYTGILPANFGIS